MNLSELPCFYKTQVMFKLIDDLSNNTYVSSKLLNEVALINQDGKNILIIRTSGSLPNHYTKHLCGAHVDVLFRIDNLCIKATVPNLLYHGKLMSYVYVVDKLEVKKRVEPIIKLPNKNGKTNKAATKRKKKIRGRGTKKVK